MPQMRILARPTRVFRLYSVRFPFNKNFFGIHDRPEFRSIQIEPFLQSVLWFCFETKRTSCMLRSRDENSQPQKLILLLRSDKKPTRWSCYETFLFNAMFICFLPPAETIRFAPKCIHAI